MFKFFLVVSAFFNILGSNEDYQVIIEEVVQEENRVFIDQKGMYQIYQESNQFIIYYNSNMIYQTPYLNSGKFVLKNSNLLYFFFNNNHLNMKEINSSGKVLFENTIINNPVNALYEVVYNNNLFIAGSVCDYQEVTFINQKQSKKLSQTDAFLIKFNDDYSINSLKLYGGVLNESFQKITFSQNNIYLAGKKDPLSGGDFGNGGKVNDSNFVVQLDKNLNILKYQILDNNAEIHFFTYAKDYLYLGLAKTIYKFDESVNIMFKKMIDESDFLLLSDQMNTILTFSEDKGYLFDMYDFSLLYHFDTTLFNHNFKAYGIEKAILIKSTDQSFLFDIACLKRFVVLNEFYPHQNTSKQVVTLFGEAQLVEETSNPVFSPLIYGIYHLNYYFKNQKGTSFLIEKNVEVQRQVNVSEGLIYPTGYKLSFTGYGFLNGKSILNNYPLEKSGDYTLELKGLDDATYTVNFSVASDQIKFMTNKLVESDIEVTKGGTFYLNFSIDNPMIEIESIIINNKTYQDFIIDVINKMVILKIKAEEEAGIYYYFVEKINYYNEIHNNKDLKSVDINQMFLVKVLKTTPQLSLIRNFDLMVFGQLNDPDGTIRYIEVAVSSMQSEEIKKYSISSHRILFNNLIPEKRYQVIFSLNYDLGNCEIQKLEIMNLSIEGSNQIDLGNFDVIQKTDTLESFKIIINSSRFLKEMSINNNILYRQKVKPVNSFLTGSVIFTFCASFSFIFKKNFKKLQNK